MRAALLLVVSAVTLFSLRAEAQAGPDGKGNYVNVHAHLLRKFPGFDPVLLSGVSVDWGGFQSQYVGAGTRITFEREDPIKGYGTGVFIGGGPQFHIPLGEQLLLIPSLNLGPRITNAGYGFAAYVSLGVAFKNESFYVGGELETPIYLQENAPEALFPGLIVASGFIGFYY